MEQKELKRTKKRLTIVFTIMVFSIASILWFSYFIYKYVSEKENDLYSFKMFVNSVLNSEINKDDILAKPNIPKNWKQYDKNENRSEKSEKKWKFDRNINYILFDSQKNVVSSDIRFDVSEELFEKISKMKVKVRETNIVEVGASLELCSCSWQLCESWLQKIFKKIIIPLYNSIVL